jgi:hypothetical protein
MIYHRNRKFLLLACLLLILIILPLVFSACIYDGYIDARGTVYQWVDAPEGTKGEIYVDINAPTDRELEPIADASVSFAIYKPTTTDSLGDFHFEYVCAPERYMMEIRVEKEGYQTLEAKFQHPGDDLRHTITIFLVSEEP